MDGGARDRLEGCLAAAVDAVNGEHVVGRSITRRGGDVEIAGEAVPRDAGVFVVAVGKAAASMARAAVSKLAGRMVGGLLVTRDGYAANSPSGMRILYAGHPVPDPRSAAAGMAVLDAAASMESNDALLVLLSGGASALTSCPAPGLEIDDIAATTSALLACGADIGETNCLRKHMSAIAGGRLARASAASRIHVLAVSDVPGDHLDVIGSGPCAADSSTWADARAIVDRYALAARLPPRVLAQLDAGARGALPESLKRGDPDLARVRATIVARNADARRAALAAAGLPARDAIDLGEILTGEARVMGPRLVALARSTRSRGPILLVAGGETVVRIRGPGSGGRSQELALSGAVAMSSQPDEPRIHLLAAGTDGSDGPTDSAGGYVDATSVSRARAAGLDAGRLLDANDSNRFLSAVGGLVRTGPTGTNVMDLALVLVESGG